MMVTRSAKAQTSAMNYHPGELLRAIGGLWKVTADGEQERTVYNIVKIQ